VAAVTLPGVVLPLIFVVLATVAAGMLAYGTDPGWAQFGHGIDFILWSRRLQWPLIAVVLVLCLTLLALVVSGKRRAWWLIALAPILALFVHRFATDPAREAVVVEDPSFVESSDAKFLRSGDYVVGVKFGDSAYAFPYSALFHSPAVLLNDRERRMILLWSPFANRALAYSVSRELSARDLEVVSSPANALLLYNSKLGEFINALTGQTPSGQKPTDFREPIAVVKISWGRWEEAHPDSKVMVPLQSNWENAPAQPVLPRYPMPRNRPELADQTRLILVATTQPLAIPAGEVDATPLNLTSDKTPLLLFRDAAGILRAFDRHVEEDLSPRFALFSNLKHSDVLLADADTNTQWSASGAAIEGPKETQGKKLTPIMVDDELYWGVMKFWYPDLRWVDPAALAAAKQPQAVQPPARAAGSRRKRAPRPVN
jgi:hypothetical protein